METVDDMLKTVEVRLVLGLYTPEQHTSHVMIILRNEMQGTLERVKKFYCRGI